MTRSIVALVAAALGVLMARTETLDDAELALIEAADSGSYYLYSYVLTNSVTSTWGLRAATMDISAASGTPDRLEATGEFRDLVTRRSTSTFSRAS